MKYTVAELFAGVGGFRIALEKSGWTTIWANQWEPGRKLQYAADCYIHHFPDQAKNPHFNVNISEVTSKLDEDKKIIPNHTLLVGGFPCQDYSVATTQAKGILGKKGVLWWDIVKIITEKKPKYILLENVDRLLASPSVQRGRDMAVLLACLRDLDYFVEWRVVNAADYGAAQKRRRVFIFASKQKSKGVKQLISGKIRPHDWLQSKGFFATEFHVKKDPVDHDTADIFEDELQDISDVFSKRFHNAGVMFDKKIYTLKVTPIKEEPKTLASILQDNVDESYYIDDLSISKDKGWKYVKGAKKIKRIAKNGHAYNYAEGAIPFPEKLNQPSRTILTGEGNKNPNRSTHLILDPKSNRYRTLTPYEVEKLNGFSGKWTAITGMPDSSRYFCMGNALVVDIVERIGKHLKNLIDS